jgi:hypothetical protein
VNLPEAPAQPLIDASWALSCSLGFAKQQPAPQHLQRPLARVSTRSLIEPLIGVRWRLLCPKPQAFA